jgi:hypothetical protein
MKKMTFILIGTTVAVIGTIAVSWAQMPPQKPTAPTAPLPGTMAATLTAKPVTPVPTAPVQPAIKAPVTTAPVAPGAQQAPLPAAMTNAPANTSALPPAVLTPGTAAVSDEVKAMQADLKKTAENDFHDKLSFPLTEDKMLAFVRAALRVEKINEKWDVQIAGAETDKMAIEYNNFGVEESSRVMSTMKGITVAEFNELSQLTAKDQKFNRIYLAYKQLFEKGAYGPVEKPASQTAKNPQPAQATPAATAAPATPATTTKPPVAATTYVPSPTALKPTPPSVPASPGMQQAPAGSPAPRYSPPATH